MSLKELNRPAREAFLETADFVARTDGVISDAEARRIEGYRREFNISEDEYSVGDGGYSLESALDILKDLPKYERAVVFEELEQLAMCDEYDEREKVVINAIRDVLEI